MKYFSGTGKFSSVYHLLSLIFFILISFVNLLGQTQSANSYTNPPYRFVHKIPFGNSYREITTSSSLCPNSDLSQGTFNDWFGCYGTWCDVNQSQTNCQGAGEYKPYQAPCTNSDMPWYNTPTGGHFAIESAGTDPCISSLQKVFPGDTHSARIGNRVCSNGGGYVDEVTYQITYDSANSFLIYRCAVVLANISDPTHNTGDKRPRFTVSVKDHLTGVLIDSCGYYDMYPNDGITVWNTGPNSYVWKDWSTIGLDLSTLTGITQGQLLDVEFLVHGCAFRAHTGYAYISAFCSAMSIQIVGCEGAGSITLTGPPGFTAYQWQGPYCPSCTIPPPIYTGNPVILTTAQGAASGNTFSLSVTALNGCQVTNVQQVIGFTQITTNFYYDSPNCVGQPVSFYDSSIINQNQVVNWKWNFGDGTGNYTGVQNPTHIFTSSGTFTVKLVSYSTEGCADSITRDITLALLPGATIGGTSSVCKNATSPLITFTGGNGVAPYTFTYKINGGSDQYVTTSSGNTISVMAPTNLIGTYIYSLVSVVDASPHPCPHTLAASATITVNPKPDTQLTPLGPICLNGAPLVLTNGTPAGGTYKVQPSGTVITSFDPAVWGAGNHPITYSWSDANGCDSISAPQIMVVQDLTTPSVFGKSSVCIGVPDTLWTDQGMTSYSFACPGATITDINPYTKSFIWPTSGTKTVNVTYIDINGCATLPKTKSVVVNDLPTPSLVSGNQNACVTKTYNYTTESSTPAGPNSGFSWNVSPGNTLTFTGNTATITWNVISGTEWIDMNYIDGNGCTAVTPTRVYVNVNPSPLYNVQGTTSVCAGSSSSYNIQTGEPGNWSVSPGGVITTPANNVNSITVNWAASNTLAHSIVTVNYTNTLGCDGVTPTNIDIQPLPIVTYTTSTPSPVCQDFPTPSIYTVDPGGAAATYQWSVTPANLATIANPTANPASITWNLPGTAAQTATLSMTATTSATNPACPLTSAPLSVSINPKPTPQLVTCFDPVTTRGAKRFLLKGGSPIYPMKGEYLITPSISALTNDGSGNYYFDPSLAPVNTYHFSYRYTNLNGCINTSSPVQIIVQAASNPACGGTMVDPRDQKSYATMSVAGRCWMAENLSYDVTKTAIDYQNTLQTDNCILEKYCPPTDPTCIHGAYYQWDELVQYKNTDAPYQGLCPPGWHVPTDAEWQTLIDNFDVNFTGASANALVGADLKSSTNTFKALLEGMNYLNGNTWTFATGGLTATMYWTSTVDGSGKKAITRGLNNPYNPSVSKYASSQANAFPVRCVRD